MEGTDVQEHSSTSCRASASNASEDAAFAESPVLVAVEFSPDSEAALVWAWNHAKAIGAPLEVLHVIHDPADSPGMYQSNNGDLLQPMEDVAQEMLAQFLDRTGRDHPDLADFKPAKALCVPGLPASTIIQVAEVHKVRHLVLGSRRRTNLARLFHGSTAKQVASNSQLPVTIVKAQD